MEKNQDILSKVQIITDGTVVKEVKLNDVKENIDIDPQLFIIDKTKGTEW
ncbi:hypothetical protein [Bacillus niameyensis]|nr:hypothetical protein [Bacillus niameyensis]